MRVLPFLFCFCLIAGTASAEPISHFAEKEELENRKERLTVFSYPKYYFDDGYKEVDTTIVPSDSWDWEVKKGVYKLRIKNDGTFEINHLDDIITQKLLGIGFFNSNTKERIIKTNLSLSNPVIIGNTIQWALPLGCSYKLIYTNDNFKDILTISNQAKTWLKNNKPNGWTMQNTWIGLIYDMDLSQSNMIESKDFETFDNVNFKIGNRITHRLKRGLVNGEWDKKKFYKNGKYVEAIKVSALDNGQDDLIFNTDVTFQNTSLYAIAVSASDTGINLWSVVDADTATDWQSQSPMGQNEYLKIDLGANLTVDEYQLFSSHGTDWPQDYHLEYSTNDSDWNLAYDINNAGDGDDTSAFTEQIARYWRIRIETAKGNWWRCNEFYLNNDGSRVEVTGSYIGCKDAHIIEWAPGNNIGGNAEMECCRRLGGDEDDKSIVIEFDISSIPASSTVDTAVLSLYFDEVTTGSSSTKTVNAARLKREWGEGVKTGINGEAAANGDVTWVSAIHNTTTWTTAGALDETDDKYASETSIPIDETTGVWKNWSIPTMTQAWVSNSADNHGVLIYEDSPSSDNGTRQFRSRNYATDATQRPKLVITYTDEAPTRRVMMIM